VKVLTGRGQRISNKLLFGSSLSQGARTGPILGNTFEMKNNSPDDEELWPFPDQLGNYFSGPGKLFSRDIRPHLNARKLKRARSAGFTPMFRAISKFD
jgi:hypothetical protein